MVKWSSVKKKYKLNVSFFLTEDQASLDILLEAVAQDEAEEHKQLATDTEDDFVKIEKYQRQTEEER